MKSVLITFLIVPSFLFGQSAKQDSIWKPMKFLTGNWKGTGEGEPGKGNYERTYQFILGHNFIEIKNRSAYAATDKHPKGEVHEDIGYMSYDKVRKTFVLRQFHVEGFVNQYKLDSISPDGKTIVFVSEALENIPTGWRAKETYQLTAANEFMETFELAPPYGKYSVYTKAVLKRIGQ